MSNERLEEQRDRLAELLSGKSLQEPPLGVLRKAIALGSGLVPRATLMDRLVELLFDSGAEPLPAGVRGAAAEERRLLYRLAGEGLETAEIDLRLRRESGGTLELTGQLLPPLEGAAVELRFGKKSRRLALGEGGEFLARNLPGTLPLELLVDDGFGPPIRVGKLPAPRLGEK